MEVQQLIEPMYNLELLCPAVQKMVKYTIANTSNKVVQFGRFIEIQCEGSMLLTSDDPELNDATLLKPIVRDPFYVRPNTTKVCQFLSLLNKHGDKYVVRTYGEFTVVENIVCGVHWLLQDVGIPGCVNVWVEGQSGKEATRMAKIEDMQAVWWAFKQ